MLRHQRVLKERLIGRIGRSAHIDILAVGAIDVTAVNAE